MKIDTNKVQIAMANACITSKELSELSGVSRESLTKMFNGKRNPKPITIGKIAKALNVKVESIIDEGNE